MRKEGESSSPTVGARFQFKQMKAFDCYRTYYDKCEDAQAMFADMISKRKSFQDFVQVRNLLLSSHSFLRETEPKSDRNSLCLRSIPNPGFQVQDRGSQQRRVEGAVDGTGAEDTAVHDDLAA